MGLNIQEIKKILRHEKATDSGRVWKWRDLPSPVPYHNMKKYLFLFTFLFVLLMPVWAFGAVYYVKNAGSDAATGLSDALAWQTISKVNGSSFSAGDSILFNKGDTWSELLTVPSSGSAGLPITFGAYGSGAMPIINGTDLVTSWTAEAIATENFTDGTGSKPISWWMLEDSGSTYADGNSTNANTLSQSGSPVRDSEYKQGSYSASVPTGNDRGFRNYSGLSSNFPFKGATTAFTIGFWAKLANPLPSLSLILSFSDFSTKGFFFASTAANKIRFRLFDGSSSGYANIDSNIAYTDAGWHHIVARWNPVSAANELSLWIDGIKQSGFSTVTTVVLEDTAGFIFRGGVALKLDEMFVFDVGLTDAQIKGIYNFGLAGGSNVFNSYYSNPLSATPGQVFENSVRMIQVEDKLSLGLNNWFWDSANTRVYVRTSGDDTPAGYTIEASQRDKAIDASGKSYITIQNLSLKNSNLNGLFLGTAASNVIIDSIDSSYNYTNGFRGVTGAVLTNITVQNSTFSWNGANGIFVLAGSHDWTIQNNIINNNSQLAALAGSVNEMKFTSGIRVWCNNDSIYNLLVQNNTIYSNGQLPDSSYISSQPYGGISGVGIWFDTIRTSNVIRYNRIYENLNAGIKIEFGKAQQVYYNIITGTKADNVNIGGDGIIIGAFSNTHSSENNLVYNNVSYGNDSAGLYVVGNSNSAANSYLNNIVKNNILIGNTWVQFRAEYGGENDGTMGSGNIYTYNCFGPEASNFIVWGTGIYKSTYADWETAYGGTTHSVQANPLFVSASAFNLQPGSPAINAGVNVGLTSDYEGNKVPECSRSTPDIGAYEYQRICPGGPGYPPLPSPPLPVTNLTATASNSQINLSWTNPNSASTQVLVFHQRGSPILYRDYQNQIYSGSNSSYTDINLTNGETYYYAIYTTDSYGQISLASNISAVPQSVSSASLTASIVQPIATQTTTETMSNLESIQSRISNIIAKISILSTNPSSSDLASIQSEINAILADIKSLQTTTQFSSFNFTKPLAFGMIDNDVKNLQSLLKSDSSIYPEGVVNGKFGPATLRAIKRFQLKYNLAYEGDSGYGYVGPRTRTKLNELYGGK